MNTALFVLRCIQVGLRLSDLEHIDYGFALDLLLESSNDNYKYKEVATQADFDAF